MSNTRLVPYLIELAFTDGKVATTVWDERECGRPTKKGIVKWAAENKSWLTNGGKWADIETVTAFSQRTGKIIAQAKIQG